MSDSRDPGLQPERTRLAWRRTTLAFSVVAVLACRQVLSGGTDALETVAVGLSGLLWVVFLVVAHGRIRVLGSSPRPAGLAPGRAVAAVVCAVALALLALPVVA
ncbi:DUF202 domain-containing protein [Streptomyces sp. NPDC057638]|uniref:DUF202 domain-containing protein n=1 Tax=Streptomyces sp. NPDC057638 TaxID=3346190 RepID=UPI0036C2667B